MFQVTYYSLQQKVQTPVAVKPWPGEQKKGDYAPLEQSYLIDNQKWVNANKKCMAFIKNTIESTIMGSIAECTSAGELLSKIKSQFTGSSKIYATQVLEQLVV